MICEDCNKCHGIKFDKGVYTVTCEANDVFQVHESRLEFFRCSDKDEIPPKPKENIMIILNCGRDIIVYDKDITCNDDMQRRIQSSDGWVEFDGMLFNTNEIAVFSFIGG